MKCKCIHCTCEYENNHDFKTSICDECFKKFNENQLQPLKDEIHSLNTKLYNANINIKDLRIKITNLIKK